MRSTKISIPAKKEERSIKAFVPLLSLGDATQVMIPEISVAKTPDYLIDGNIYIEIKELHDGVDTSQSAQWGAVTNRLQKILTREFKSEKISGLYSITTPRVYSIIGESKYTQVAKEIIQAIKDKNTEIISFGIKFDIHKINDKYDEVYLTSHWTGSVNPAGTIFQNIGKKLNIANKQLSYKYKHHVVKRKIVLLVNKYRFADRISEVIEGLSYCYADLLKYKNIDEIWFQQETRDGNFIHTKIYSKRFLDEFENFKIDADDAENQKQFQLWYWALDKIDGKKPQIWDTLRRFLEKHTPDEIFDDPFKRQEMTRLGLWLLEQNMINETIWLISRFINDSDPIEPPNEYSGDPTFDYNAKIKDGEDPIIITSVMGHLAWTVQALARKTSPEDYGNLIRAFEFTNEVLTKRTNLYCIQQWLIPLIEIANRRLWLLDTDKEAYASFKKLLIGTTDDRSNSLISKYGKYSSIAKNLARVFSSFKDLSTEEVKFVIDNLVADEDIGVLLIYFAIYRKNHYKKGDEIGDKFGVVNPAIWEYDSSYAEAKLKELICKNEEGRQTQNIAWNFWKIAKDSPSQFETLKTWYDLLFNQPINFTLFSYLEFILEDSVASHPEECKKWAKQLLDISVKYIEDNGVMKFMQRRIVSIPKTLVWLEENDPEYYKSLNDIVAKLEKDGVLSRHDCIYSNEP